MTSRRVVLFHAHFLANEAAKSMQVADADTHSSTDALPTLVTLILPRSAQPILQ